MQTVYANVMRQNLNCQTLASERQSQWRLNWRPAEEGSVTHKMWCSCRMGIAKSAPAGKRKTHRNAVTRRLGRHGAVVSITLFILTRELIGDRVIELLNDRDDL